MSAGGCSKRGCKIGFSPGGIRVALPPLHDSSLFEAAERLWRGGGVAGAQTSGIFQLARRQHVAWADLRGVEVRDHDAPADHLPRSVWERLVSDPVHLAAGRRALVLQQSGVSCAGDLAAVGAFAHISSAVPVAVTSLGLSFGVCMAAGRRRNCRRTNGVGGRVRWWRCCSFCSQSCAVGRVTRGNLACNHQRRRRRKRWTQSPCAAAAIH